MKVFSIIVAYNPNIKKLLELTKYLKKNDVNVIIVDNNLKNSFNEVSDFSNCIIIPLRRNTGLAYAQNVGIRYALNSSADIIVFFDQDAIIKDDFLKNLLKPLKNNEPKVVGPCIIDEKSNNEIGSFVLNKLNLPRRIYSWDKRNPIPVDLIISSGTAVTSITFQIVGYFDEHLFIDFIDFEWAIRCKKKKIPIYVSPLAILYHSLGESANKKAYFSMSIHNPDRIYYQIRNPFLLLRRKHIPTLYSLYVIGTSLVHKFLVSIFSFEKRLYLNNYCLGLFHGIIGKSGPKPKKS